MIRDSLRKIHRSICIFMTAALVLSLIMPAYADAGSGSIRHASDIGEYIDATEAADDQDPIFGTRRIKVKKELSSLEGAEKGVCYDGCTLLSFDTVEETREAYDRLCAKYGESDVVVDLPMLRAEAAGWGYEYMNLDDQIKRSEKVHGKDGTKVTVAVIDSGISKYHEVFAGRTISPYSRNILQNSTNYSDQTGHGTEVAGIIAESTPGNVELMILKVFGSDETVSFQNVGTAVRYAADNGADVINMSMSIPVNERIKENPDYEDAIRTAVADLDSELSYAAGKNIVICAAAGNEGGNMDELGSFPAGSTNTIAVGSIDKDRPVNDNDTRSYFSNYGSTLDFCAPGSDLTVAKKDTESDYWQDYGTSLAAPYITACCAYIKMDDPSAGNFAAKETLKSIAVDYGSEGRDDYFGWGMPKFEDFVEVPADPDAKARKVKTVTVNASTVNAKAVDKAVGKAGGSYKYVTKIVLGKKVRKISAKTFAKYRKVTTVELKTRKLSKKSVKNSLKNSKVKTVKVKAGSRKVNKKYVKIYKKYFTKKNAGRKVTVRL
ncbi:MAG: hypothetical protein E7220_00460 [Clostridiales bacterium]|nr:hypothetical protein [Clostridiales bacterium]